MPRHPVSEADLAAVVIQLLVQEVAARPGVLLKAAIDGIEHQVPGVEIRDGAFWPAEAA